MKKLLLISAATSLLATAAFSDDGYDHDRTAGAAVQIEPQYRTKIKSYVTERDHEGDDRGWRPRAGRHRTGIGAH